MLLAGVLDGAVAAPAVVAQCTAETLVAIPPAPAPACAPVPARVCAGAGPRLVQVTEALAPGPEAYLHVRADRGPGEIEVRIDGVRSAPLYVDDPSLGGLYALPANARCGVEVAVRDAALAEDSDCRVLKVQPGLFEEVAPAVGLNVLHDGTDEDAEEFPISTGIAFGDYDSDGRVDLLVANFGLPAQLFRNVFDAASGELRFTDASVAAGVDGIFRGASAAFIDIDGDGDLDLYIGRDGRDVLLRNLLTETGEARCEDISAEAGLHTTGPAGDGRQRSAGLAFGDYDGDGRPDLYLSTHITRISEHPQAHQDRLLWNAGGRFEDVTALLGDAATQLAGFAAMWFDIDGDGDQDLLVSSDHDAYAPARLARPGVLWRNDGPAAPGADGRAWRFTDVSEASGFALFPDGKQQGLNAMGMDLADLDGDGRPAIALSNIGPNVLFDVAVDDGAIRMTDIAAARGVQRSHVPWQPRTPGSERRAAWQDMSVTWGVHLFDADNDGDRDLFMAGGSPPAGPMVHPMFGRRPLPNAYFENDGHGHFTELTEVAGLADPQSGMGSAIADVDGDGWMDIAVANYRGPLRLYRNRGAARWPGHGALQVALRAAGGGEALGARVILETDDGRRQVCEHIARPGLSGGTRPDCHFGLGTARPAALTIVWPDGSESVVDPPPAAATRLSCQPAAG